jgi:hypothetical protein
MDKDIKLIIDEISRKLGTTSEYLFEKLVKQAKINGVTTLLQLCFGLLIGILLAIYTIFIVKLGIHNYSKVEDYIGIYFALGISDALILVIYVITMFERIYFGIDESIKCLKNPEGWAIDELLNKFN